MLGFLILPQVKESEAVTVGEHSERGESHESERFESDEADILSCVR